MNADIFTPIEDYDISGKLTLRSIRFYQEGASQLIAPIEFEYYGDDDYQKNPNYHPLMTDYWGFYKSDATNRGYSSYRTPVSKDHVDAWSLRSIDNQTGAITEISYESDTYDHLIDDQGHRDTPNSKIYHIETAGQITTDGLEWNVTMEDNVPEISFSSLFPGQNLNVNLYYSSNANGVLPWVVYGGSSSTDPSDFFMSHGPVDLKFNS